MIAQFLMKFSFFFKNLDMKIITKLEMLNLVVIFCNVNSGVV